MHEEENALWRPHAGGFGWPAVVLAAGVLALVGLAWSGLLPFWASSLVATLAAYAAFTVMHEASHGNIHGRHRRLAKYADLLAWIVGLTLVAPYPAFRVLHLRHHAHTNHPEKDPDYFVAGSFPHAVARGFTTVPAYYGEFLFGLTSKTPAARRARPVVLTALAFYFALAATLSALGLWREVLALWLLPALLASPVLALLFDWLPHRPHTSRERYRDTHAIDSRLLDVLFLGQNLHLVHHLFPRVPFHRYRVVFDAGRERFLEKGARIDGPLRLPGSPIRE